MKQLAVGLLALAATLLAARRWEAVDELRFALAWAAVLLALDGTGRLRHGTSALPRAADWLWAAAGSLLFWDLFELVNLRLQNWWYVGVSRDLLPRSLFAAISFATVLPAIRLGEAALRRKRTAAAIASPPTSAAWPIAIGALLLGLALLFPRFAFPLAWLFLWPLSEGLAALLPADGAPTPLQSLRAGDHGRLIRLLLVGLLLGLLWESLNWGCARGWVYTVPYFEEPKLFEMPLPGYLGYLPFAVEGAAMLAVLDRLAKRISRAAALGALAALFGLHVLLEATAFPLSTISTAPAVSMREMVRAECARSPRPRRCELARLALVAHLGARNAEQLGQAGVLTVEDLAAIEPERLHRRLDALGAPQPLSVVRLWTRAAQREVR